MMNALWLGFVAIGIIVAVFTGKGADVTKAAFDNAKTAVDLSLGLIGTMALWLGIMKIAEESGIIRGLARVFRPIMRVIFPDVPPDHPAMGAMIMNISANMLGLGNAATPLGLKAMKELQELNEDKEEASNAMVMFLAINTAGIQLLPTTAISLLIAAGAKAPYDIIAPALVAGLISTVVGIIAAKLLSRLPGYRREKAGGR